MKTYEEQKEELADKKAEVAEANEEHNRRRLSETEETEDE